MSLVATWVLATDGRFYEDPVLEGEGWFLCFDDDEPPELVIATEDRRLSAEDQQVLRIKALAILSSLGFRYTITSKLFKFSYRDFSNGNGLTFAGALFLRIDSPIPVPKRFSVSGTLDEVRQHECCLYTFGAVQI